MSFSTASTVFAVSWIFRIGLSAPPRRPTGSRFAGVLMASVDEEEEEEEEEEQKPKSWQMERVSTCFNLSKICWMFAST